MSEQRIADALAVLAFGPDDWRGRGIGDRAKAPNLSRRTLGDIEFTHVDRRWAIGDAVRTHVIDVINRPTVPQWIRDTAAKIVSDQRNNPTIHPGWGWAWESDGTVGRIGRSYNGADLF
ncbi:hypothetical protein ACFSSC_11490 [Corynebacterium mendelii]|uniref:Uncharacterized protein n=1 Tax=Corynebacterium mendelii TaxID=2765362 RepID=A0A939IUW5_9CORY|nr:hypothetical protein [Corynebacterium mendelii]MBN9643626.1 hypothetical protein [Corynebacterium mendelii]